MSRMSHQTAKATNAANPATDHESHTNLAPPSAEIAATSAENDSHERSLDLIELYGRTPRRSRTQGSRISGTAIVTT